MGLMVFSAVFFDTENACCPSLGVTHFAFPATLSLGSADTWSYSPRSHLENVVKQPFYGRLLDFMEKVSIWKSGPKPVLVRYRKIAQKSDRSALISRLINASVGGLAGSG